MIDSKGAGRAIVGYARFVEMVNSDTENAIKSWAEIVFNFIVDFETDGKDFRKVRLHRILANLLDFIELIDKRGLDARLKGAREKWPVGLH